MHSYMKLLLIEDHRDIAGIIFDFFEIKGYVLDYASDGRQGLELAKRYHYDLIILDLMLPDIDGLTICAELRHQGLDTPILMLTAKDRNEDVLSGFKQGADDYLVKPFDLNILEARIQAVYRRRTGSLVAKKLHFGELTLDLENRFVIRNECRFRLNKILFATMKILMIRAPDIVTREELVNELWQGEEPENDVLRSHIYQLRNLIDKPFEHAYIKTLPKVGYQLVEDARS